MKIIFVILTVFILMFSCDNMIRDSLPPINKEWTIMFYLGADNDLEYELINNVEQIKKGYDGSVNVIIFIDRSKKYSSDELVFGENFSGGRIYRVLKENKLELLKDHTFFENIPNTTATNIDSANILVLKKFIEFVKSTFPAEYYSLIIGSHGGGVRSKNIITKNITTPLKDIVYDEEENSWIYTAMFTDFLDGSHSVDLLGFDACFMGNIEFLYQIRTGNNSFNARYVVTSPAMEWSYGWDYYSIFKRVKSSLTPNEFGEIIVQEYFNYTNQKSDDQILTLYDTSNIKSLKNNFDSLFVSLKDNYDEIKDIRGEGSISQNQTLLYFDTRYEREWLNYPYFDVYDICDKISKSDNFDQSIIEKAEIVKNDINSVILSSFSGNYYRRFNKNITGLSFFFPDGMRIYNGDKMWYSQKFYNALNDNNSYGKLSFCIDNATMNNQIVENYFEVLNYWFDKENIRYSW